MRRLLSLPFTLPAALLMLTLGLTGCSTPNQSFYHQENFSETDTYSRSFAENEAQVCEAARRALLGQGYIISQFQHSVVDGTKSFQPKGDQHVEITFHIVCASNGKPEYGTTLFANATQDRFALKKTNNSASVGVGMIGSVSMPFSSSDDSLVRIASETIVSAQFYDRFFQAVERYSGSGAEEDAVKASILLPDDAPVTQQKKEPR